MMVEESQGSRKLSLLARTPGTKAPLSNASFLLIAESTTSDRQLLSELGTDHVGYASINIDSSFLSNTIQHLWLEPLGNPEARVDLLGALNASTGDVPLGIEIENLSSDVSVAPGRRTSLDGKDYELSPSSFGFGAEGLVIGDDACKKIVPGVADDFVQQFHQILRFPSQIYKSQAKSDATNQREIRIGRMLKYEARWREPRFALGDVLYTLPLAPCEDVKLAIVDWTREQSTIRQDEIRDAQQQLHDQSRDRSIEDSVRAMVSESRSGFEGKGVLGAGLNLGHISGSIGLGLGGFSRNGSRDLTSDTSQSLSDNLRHASSRIREVQTSSIVQGEQAEQVGAETRRIRNHNACHALTIIYYQMVRNYLLETKYTDYEDVLFVQFPTPKFTEKTARLHQRVLESVLLDSSLSSCFPALNQVLCGQPQKSERPPKSEEVWEGDLEFKQFRLTIRTREDFWAGTNNYVKASLKNSGNTEIKLMYRGKDYLDNPDVDDFEPGDVRDYGVRTEKPIKWEKITQFGLGCFREDVLIADEWQPFSVKLVALHEKRDVLLVDYQFPQSVKLKNEWTWVRAKKPGEKPKKTNIESSDQSNLTTAKCCVEQLLDHLNHHLYHYTSSIYLAQSTTDRIVELDKIKLNNSALSDFLQPIPVGVYGNQLVYRLLPGSGKNLVETIKKEVGAEWPKEPKKTPLIRQPLSYPVRGAFAEVNLSHCSACSKRDPSISFDEFSNVCQKTEAPNITDEMLKSRRDAVNPTALSISNNGWLPDIKSNDLPSPTNTGTLLSELIKSGLWGNADIKVLGDALEKLLAKLPATKPPEKKKKEEKKGEKKKTSAASTTAMVKIEDSESTNEDTLLDSSSTTELMAAEDVLQKVEKIISLLEDGREKSVSAILREAVAYRLLNTSPARLYDVSSLLEQQHKAGRLSDDELAAGMKQLFGI